VTTATHPSQITTAEKLHLIRELDRNYNEHNFIAGMNAADADGNALSSVCDKRAVKWCVSGQLERIIRRRLHLTYFDAYGNAQPFTPEASLLFETVLQRTLNVWAERILGRSIVNVNDAPEYGYHHVKAIIAFAIADLVQQEQKEIRKQKLQEEAAVAEAERIAADAAALTSQEQAPAPDPAPDGAPADSDEQEAEKELEQLEEALDSVSEQADDPDADDDDEDDDEDDEDDSTG